MFFAMMKSALNKLENTIRLVLSPGPGIPDEARLLKPLIKEYGATKSILGVCLGLQAIAEVYGGKLKNLEIVYHGVSEHDGTKRNRPCAFQGYSPGI